MSTETSTSDVSLVQDEDVLRKMWQETEDFGKKKEIRSHMYKIREARLKDFYTAGEDRNTSSESRQHSTITKTSNSSSGIKSSDLTTLADNLADHSFLSLKSKEIRDSESPTKDSYKITETRKLDDRDWNVVESNESSKDGKTHTTTRMATTSGRQDVDGGEMNYAAKSEQKATVYKDGDDKNFTKSVGASSGNVIKQEAFGGDDNSKFYTSSTTTSSSSKYTSEQRSTTGDGIDYEPTNVQNSSRAVRTRDDQSSTIQRDHPSSAPVRSSQTVVRKEYTENIPNEFKNHPNYVDGNTKVTTETKTLPDGSTVTTTRYETKGATKFSSSSSTTSSSTKQVSSSEQKKNHQDSERYVNVARDSRICDNRRDDNSVTEIVKNQHADTKTHIDRSDLSRVSKNQTIEERRITENDIKRSSDLALIGRDVKNLQNVDIVLQTRDVPVQETQTITTTITKSTDANYDDDQVRNKNIIRTTNIESHGQTIPIERNQVITTVTKNINNKYDNQKATSDDFLSSERKHVETTKKIEHVPKEMHSETIEIEFVNSEIPRQKEPAKIKKENPPEIIEIEFIPKDPSPRRIEEPRYEQPERRTPIKPGQSEFDERPSPTDGQYDTTYRTDYIPRRISVEVSPTHDAFARSLRSISPDRISKIGSTRSLRTNSTTSLRSTSSPERPNKSRASPVKSPNKKTSRSPEKIPDGTQKPRYGSPEKIPPYGADYQHPMKSTTDTRPEINTDTITRRKKTTNANTEVDSNTLTRKPERVEKPRSRSISPTSTASDIEFFRHHSDIVTDLDTEEFNKNVSTNAKITRRRTEDFDNRPSTLDITSSKKSQKITEKSSTSPLSDLKNTSISSGKPKSPTKEPTEHVNRTKPKPIRRTDTYEERCKEILGIGDGKDTPRKASLPNTSRERLQSPTKSTSPSKSKDGQSPHLEEFPHQMRKSPEKKSPATYPEKPQQTKQKPSVQEFPAQIRKSPQKEPSGPYPEKTKNAKRNPSVQEFPAQIRKSPRKEPLEPYPIKTKGDKHPSSVQEFPSQTRKSSQKEPLELYPEKPKGNKHTPSVQEFPAQMRKSPQKEPLEPYPTKAKGDKHTPSVQEFPAQTRKSPQKEPLEPYPTKPKADKYTPSVQEFPAQIKTSPQREPLEPYPEKPSHDKYTSSVEEFPAQVRKSPEKELLEPYQETPKRTKQMPNQFRKSPERILTDIFDRPLEKSPNKVSLDDLPNLKMDKVSLDDIPSVVMLEKQKPARKISLSDLDNKPDRFVDDFISNEKIDTEITLKKYRDKSPHVLSGIPTISTTKTDIKITKKKSKDKNKEKKVTNLDSDSETSTEEEENLEEQIIQDLCDVIEYEDRKITENEKIQREVSKTQYQTKSTNKELKDDKKQTVQTNDSYRSTPKTKSQKPQEPEVEDYITVTKAQLLQSSSKAPVEEVIHTQKFMTILCQEEEEDRKTKTKTSLTEKEERTDIMLNGQAQKPNKTVKKDSPDKKPVSKLSDKKKQTELLIKKEKIDNTRKINTETNQQIKKSTMNKKTIDEQTSYETEYADQYCVTKKDVKTSKTPAKVTAKITLTPVDKTQVKKNIIQDKVSVQKNQKVDIVTKKIPNGTSIRPNATEKRHAFKLLDKSVEQSKITKTKVSEIKQPRIITRTTIQKTVDIQPAKRHIVSTIINIKPKIKPETISKTIHKTTATKTILAPKTTKTQPKDSKLKRKPIQNGHVSTDEGSDVEIIEKVPVRETFKHDTTRKSPYKKPGDSRTKKCITTKSILIANAVADQREIIVDLKRSKSSREGTPDRICPYPVSEDVDVGAPRYPDRVIEPDEGAYRSKPRIISDIPLYETENVSEFERIREVTKDTTKTTKSEVESTDECLLSVNEKVSKFLTTAEQVTKKPTDMKPAPKVDRPTLEVEESLKEDECLLSVSDKVNKFIATAEQLATGSREVQTPKTPKYKDDIDESKPKVKSSLHREELDRTQTNVETRQHVTVETEKSSHVRKSISPEKIEQSPRPKSREEPSPRRSIIEPSKYKTPDRNTADFQIKKTAEEVVKTRKDIELEESTPKTSRRYSKDEPKEVLSPTGRLRSTETIQKAKALFENIGKDRDIERQKDILNRPSVFEGRKLKKMDESFEEKKYKDVRTRLTYDEVRRSPSPDKPKDKSKTRTDSPDKEIPHYMAPLDRTIRDHQKDKTEEDTDMEGSLRSRETSPDRDIPHYMLPLDRTVRERSPHKENLKQLDDIMHRSVGTDEVDVQTTKFGVTLRRTDSGRMTTGARKSSVTSVDKQTEDLDIEEIYDLEYLEKLLETIVGYDIRRRIRSQIRFIKRRMEESTVEQVIHKRASPMKEGTRRPTDDSTQTRRISSTDRKKTSKEVTSEQDTTTVTTEVSEYQSSYSSKRRTSSEFSVTRKSPSPVGRKRDSRSRTPNDKSPSPPRRSSVTDREAAASKGTTTTRIFQTDLKKTKPLSKTVVSEKPEWVTQKTLRKVSETSAPITKTVSTTTTKRVTTKKEGHDAKATDVITSSYGVGPMDENGSPLFGLKALRAQNKSEKTKVQGTVIRSHYHSENGGEPEGEISITKFSTDPSDLGTENVPQKKGITSLTTTQKFGYKGTPSLKTIHSKDKKTTENEMDSRSTTKTSKVTRRGSVKEMSQKFIENAVDTLKSERQSSYPKAGLILRTSSFKETTSNDANSSREPSPATQEVHQKITTTVRKSTTTSDGKKGDTFLSNKSRITGVQDVISRMKNQEVDVEDTEEDTEARNLLNKFIGSQVLLSGMESHVSKPTVGTSESTKRTTKITTTTSSTESSKPSTVTTTFTHPITAELLETVWDDQTLKLLLEQSTDYEDRRIIRSRLREVMAEQEACAELVEKASSEATMKESGSTVHGTTRTYTEGPVTTTSQVTTRVTSQQQVKKPMSPFAKFRQLDKQNSLNSPPSTPKSPNGGGPLFKFTDPSLNQSANTVKQRLLQWCQMKTKEYENIQLDNFSTSWADGMAFCALIHHFLPEAFDYKILNPRNRRHNFTLAFRVADEKAGVAPLLDVDDMVAISKPDWKCVFTYVQSIYRRFKDED